MKYKEDTNLGGKKVIQIKCKGADTLPIDRILEFQNDLKTLSKDNEKKLRNSILKFGFIAPFFVWDNQGEWKLLDGHQYGIWISHETVFDMGEKLSCHG